MTPTAEIPLVCLRDGSVLHPASGEPGLVCPTCGTRVPSREGVLKFVERDDPFYEAHYFGRVRYVPAREGGLALWPLWLVNFGYVWQVRRYVAAGGTILELGCAGGIAYFGKRYRTIGADVSWTSVRNAVDLYDRCLQVDAREGIPFPEGSLDGIVSSFFWEHIPADMKPAILRECRRVLRPGGHVVFLYDVETENRFIGAMKRREPDRYRARFIDNDGHLGYQTPAANAAIFETSGFRVVENRGYGLTAIHSPDVYAKMATSDAWYGAVSRVALRIVGGALRHPWTALGRLADESVGRLLPLDRARVLVTVCRREP